MVNGSRFVLLVTDCEKEGDGEALSSILGDRQRFGLLGEAGVTLRACRVERVTGLGWQIKI